MVGQPFRIIHATAPIRICDNGGWTDTWVARHGKVFNIAVRPLVTVRVDAFPPGSREARVVLDVGDRGTRYAPDLDAMSWGLHPLVEAAFREIRPPDDADIEVTIRFGRAGGRVDRHLGVGSCGAPRRAGSARGRAPLEP